MLAVEAVGCGGKGLEATEEGIVWVGGGGGASC